MENEYKIGTAGWSIPKIHTHHFPLSGSHLQRYASVFGAVEINSSFYRDHLPKTYKRWAETVPEHFRFSVKLHQRFTHEQRLLVDSSPLAGTLEGIKNLGRKLGALLVQLPPSLPFHGPTARDFFAKVRENYSGPLAFEPRHLSWAEEAAQALLKNFAITKVRADPEPCPLPEKEWESSSFRYYRLHGYPQIYKSKYSVTYLATLSAEIRKGKATSLWCIFDNTTFGHATANAIKLNHFLNSSLRGASNSNYLAS